MQALSAYTSAGVRYLRRNTRQVVLFSVAGIGAGFAIYYARKQYQLISSTLDDERERGTRGLRMVYLASKSTVDTTLHALLRPGRDRIFACENANPDPLVILLRTKDDGIDKKDVWERLKVSAIVRLVSSVYYIVLVYVVLLVQVNLIARYSATDVDAPIQDLPQASLSLESKQRFLSIARRRLFELGGIEDLVHVVESAVKEVVGDFALTQRVGPQDVRGLLHRIRRAVEARGGLDSIATNDESDDEDAPILSARWLLAGSSGDMEDANVTQLMNESLDVCDGLGFSAVVRDSVDSLMDITIGLLEEHLWSGGSRNGEANTVAFAPVVAKIANVSKLVLEAGATSSADGNRIVEEEVSLEAMRESLLPADGPFVRSLIQSAGCDAFGASVFLSGERETRSNNIPLVP